MKRQGARASRAASGPSAVWRSRASHLTNRDIIQETAILKLRQCRITGFKALDSVSLAIPNDVLILIGNNGAGKSSTLQALGFIRDFASGSPQSFFETRGWSRRDVKSHLGGGSNTLRVDLLLEANRGRSLLWQLSWGFNSSANLREALWLQDSDEADPLQVLSYCDAAITSQVDERFALRGLTLKGSMLSVIDPGEDSPIRPLLRSVAEWAAGITSLELLSPKSMREGTRGRMPNIGARGEHLASFLANLSADNKSRIVDRLASFYPLSNFDTTRKRAGWVDLRIAESFGIGEVGIAQISDGFLRLLALCAIPEFGSAASLVLLDEVEDGIEPHILPNLITRIVDDARTQFVMTSHSPLLVNFFEPREVALIGRRSDGSAMAAALDRLPSVVRGLEYFGGGEMWANMERGTVGGELARAAEARDRTRSSRFSVDYVRRYVRQARSEQS